MEAFDSPDYAEVGAQVAGMQLGVDPSDLHGSLCGFLCGGGDAGRHDWLPKVMAEPDPGQVERDSALDRLFVATEALLESTDYGFELLLPDDEAPIEERGDAVLGWCRGFLGGFGLATGRDPPLSEHGAEALRELANVAAAELSYDDPATDEESLVEIIEFVRVNVLLLRGDCVLGPRHRKSLN